MISPRAKRAILASTLMAAGAIAFLMVLLPGPKPRLYSHSGWVMKTDFSAKVILSERTAEKAADDLEAAFEAADRVEKLMSRFLPTSDVSRLATAPSGTPVKINPLTARVLLLSKEIHQRSGGAFDVTVGPLVRLYKYTRREEKRLPTDAEIAVALKLVGSDKLTIDADGCTATLNYPITAPLKDFIKGRDSGAGVRMTVDLSAVAKGFSVDLALEKLRERGARAALVEIGGEVRAFGTKPGMQPWRVGVQHPREPRKRMAALELNDRALATSGDYQKYFKKGGKRASHIIDARTGKPLVGGAVSVTVLAPTCALADGLATAISVLGAKEGLKLVESYNRKGRAVEALIIEEEANGRLMPHASPGLQNLEIDL